MPDDFKKLRVLVIDDYPLTREIAKEMLTNFNCEVEDADNAKQALAFFDQAYYDLVLMDVTMPEVDGFQLTKLFREKESADRHTPIVAFSANTGAEFRDNCLAAGMDDYLSKPIKPSDLQRILQEYCSISQ